MTTMLQQTLRQQCQQTGWCYAVFWKLKRLGRMMLTWEDGYCEFANPSLISTSALMMPELFLNGLNVGENSLSPVQDECSLEDKIGLAVAKMSCQVFLLGEGIIGRVAFTGKHQWILVENNCTGLANSTGSLKDHLMLEAGWQNQFAAGIKTIVVIAVVPHGVVQLGSTHLIMENLELVNHIKTLFVKLQNVPGVFVSDFQEESLTMKNKVPVLSAMPLLPNHIENSPILQGIPVVSVQDHCNLIFQEKDSSNVLDRSNGPLALELRGSKTRPCLLASASSSDTSAKVLGHSSPLQINNVQLRSSSPTVKNYQGRKTGGRTISPSTYNQQALHATPGESESCLPSIKQNLNKATCFPGKSFSSLICGQNSIQHQMHASLNSSIEKAPIQNSLLSKAETNEIGSLLGSSLNMQNKATKKRLFNEEDPYLREFKCPMKPSFQTSHKGVYHPGDTLASLKPVLQATEMATVDINSGPMGKAENGNAAFLTPPLSLVDTCFSGSCSKHACKGLANNTEEQPNTEILSSSIAPFWNGVKFSEALGLEQCWITEVLEKDKPPIFQDGLADKLGSTKVSMEDTAMSFAELSSLKSGPWENRFEGGNKIFRFPRKGQYDDSREILKLSACNEVSEALGPCFPMIQDEDIWGEVLLPKWNLTSPDLRNQSFEHMPSSMCFSDMDVSGTLNFSADKELAGEFLPASDSGNLLNAVIGKMQLNAYQRQDDDMSGKTTCLRSSSTPFVYTDSCLPGETSECEQKQSELIGIPHTEETMGKVSSKILSSTSSFQEERIMQKSSSKASLKIHCDSWVDEDDNGSHKDVKIMNVKKFDDLVKMNRKKARPGKSARPRPKDRQKLQDHVRELREIIPGGTKCSIDSLLERTIKHMSFLQCLLKHADKLKLSSESKVFHKEGSLLARDDLKGGTSWALELGGQKIRCPVIVENLDQPRQMLVEMLCEEQGFFLEIADTIQGLGLIILKGFMEAHNLKIWARFVVEPNRNVQLHRMEVLLSLMHLLQPHAMNNSNETCQPVPVEPQKSSSARIIPEFTLS